MPKRLTRSEVPENQTWNLEDLFRTKADWKAEMESIEADLSGVVKYKGRLGEGAGVLLECAEALEALTGRAYRAFNYAGLALATDGTNPEYQEAMGLVGALAAKLEAETAFVRSEVLALPDGTVERYLEEEPALGEFRRMLEKMLAEKPYLLSPETEVALASFGEVLEAPYTIYQRSKSSDMTFEPVKDKDGKEHPMSFATYEVSYETSPDTVLRRNAFASFTKGLNAYKNTFGAIFGTEVKRHVVEAKLRKYPSVTHMLLQPQEIPVEVYHNLHDVIQAELAPHMRKYVEFRKRKLGLDKILYCDIEAPLDPEYDPKVSFEDAEKMLAEAFEVMGPEYVEILRAAFKDRWIDWSDNVGKSTGAFCADPYGVHPYILTTWADSLRCVFTLAHELGHAVHSVYSQRNQRLVNTDVSLFFVEAPSTIHELILGNHILANKSDLRMRRWVLMTFLATYYHNFVRHMLEAELQRRLYRLAEAGQTITANTLSSTKGEVLNDFWAGVVEVDEGARLTWMRQPHYYNGLYPYSYSAGLTCATAVAQDIREEGAPAIERWINVLKAGGTKKPLDLMKMAGVDLSKPEPIKKAVAYVGSLVDELVESF